MPELWRESSAGASPTGFRHIYKLLTPTYSYNPLLPSTHRARRHHLQEQGPQCDEAHLATKSVATAEKKTRKDYVGSFANAVTRLASNNGDLLAVVPQILVSDFGATRSELWLWDDSSKSAYLTHSSGRAA